MTTQTMPRLHVGDGWRAGALTVFPVWVEGLSVRGLAVGSVDIEVAEREGSPAVGELVVRNRSPKAAMLLEGEVLEGGWQHRVINADFLLCPGRAEVIEVSCIEQGRWGGSATHGRRGRLASGSVRLGLRNPASRRQGDVWRSVSRFEPALGPTPTFSLVDQLDRVAVGLDAAGRPTGRGHASEIPARPLQGQRGVVVGFGGRPAWLELMPSPRSLAAYWTAMVDAALLDGQLAPRRDTPGQSARNFAKACGYLGLESTGGAGAGSALGATRGSLNVRGLATAGRELVHALAFDADHRLWED